jgi:hypothetical protein
MANSHREELRRRLEELARSEPPRDLSPGAMCYSMMGPPAVAEYVCLLCGQKTLYALEPRPDTLWGRLRGQLLEVPERESAAEVRIRDTDTVRRLPRDRVSGELRGVVEYGLPHFRRQLAECGAGEAGIRLDESQFCEHCRPGVRAPKLVLVVQSEGREHRVEGIEANDVVLLSEFLQRKKKHVGGFGAETPLKDHARRLAELLGLEPPDIPRR